MDINIYAKELSKQIRNSHDKRIKKPFILFNQDDYRKYISYSNIWLLKTNDFVFYSEEPNDIALYSNLALLELPKAKEFFHNYFEAYLRNNDPNFMVPYISDELNCYYDYFESIIKGIIFSYTSLEAFANICIHESYVYVNPKGKKLNRKKIEWSFSLPDKLELILSDILRTSDPKNEKWWPVLKELKEIRDEIIHSKPSKSNNRYSKFIDRRIFEIIECHLEIINFYGKFIFENQKSLLDEYPYDMGFDEFQIKYVANEEYISIWNDLHNTDIKKNDES